MSIYTYNDWSRKQLVIAAARVEVLLAREELAAYTPSDGDEGLEDYYRDELLDASLQLHKLEELPASEFDYRMPWVDA